MSEHTETDAALERGSESIDESICEQGRRRVVPARLFIGLIVLVCAEVFSGASVRMGLWNPWTLIVTFWLYFAHFFFFTTLAVTTRRTSLASLYLWGVLYGLYEGWITKVIWHGYGGSGNFVVGSIGPFGFSELSMAFLFHPVMSFIVPLAVACVLFPDLRRLFPDLAWLTGRSRSARFVQIYMVLSFVPIMAINSGGPVNLAGNLVFVVVLLFLLSRWTRSTVSQESARSIVVFGRRGFLGLCLYLTLLYGLTYPLMIPEGLPTAGVQLLTLGFYAIAIAGLWLQRPRKPLPAGEAEVDQQELTRIKALLAILLVLALVCSPLGGTPMLYVPIMANFVVWGLLGFALTGIALWQGVRGASPFTASATPGTPTAS